MTESWRGQFAHLHSVNHRRQMSFISLITELFRNLNQQRLRSFLTLFGIMWGTATLILLLAFGTGFRDQTVLNMRGMGDQIVIMFPGQTTKPFKGYGIGRPIRFREADVELMNQQIQGLDVVTPEYSGSLTLSFGENRRNSTVGGVYPVYGEMRNIFERGGGRWLNNRDIEERRRVVFLGNRLAENLFGSEDPEGKLIMIRNTPFRVIGVMQEKTQNSSYSQRDEDRAFIPATTYASFMGTTSINNILYIGDNPEHSAAIQDKIYEVFGRKHNFDPADIETIGIWDTSEFWAFISTIFLGINGFLGVIGFFTLAVGGIGVANIMFVVVQERMKEIGIRRCTGAKRRHIMSQFFLETFLIIGTGALAGYILGWLLIAAAQNNPIQDAVGVPYFSPSVGLTAFAVLSIVGLASGLLPAWRASRLDIIECLR